MDNVFVFNWTIERFSWCRLSTGKFVYSPAFIADTPYQTHWRLKLYPKGILDSRFVSCFLECHNYNEPRERFVDFDIGIFDAKNTLTCSSKKKAVFSSSRISGFCEFIAWDFFMAHYEELLPNDTLRIQCRLKATPPTFSKHSDLYALSQTFNKLLTFGYFYDLALRGEDVVLHAHTDIVCARAPEFGSKIHRMQSRVETRGNFGSSIYVGDDVPDGALRPLLLYLYCGVLETTEPLVWDQLYGLAETYELYDMKRDICPTTTASSVRTRVLTLTKSVFFDIKHFSTSIQSCMGRFIDLDFARITVEYYANDDMPDCHRVGLIVWCFTSDLSCTDQIFCSVSVIDVNGESHFTSVHEIMHDDIVTAKGLPSLIWKRDLLNNSFLSDNDTIRLKFSFKVISGLEPTTIEAQKEGRALSLGLEAPPQLTLSRLSEDLEYLVHRNTIANIDPYWMLSEASGLQKAIFSAWSTVHEEVFRTSNKRKKPSSSSDTEICALVYLFLCTGSVAIPSLRTAIGICSVAMMYKISSLQHICQEYLKSELTVLNATSALVSAHGYQDECYRIIEDFVCHNFDQIAITNEWGYLTMAYPNIADEVGHRLRDRGETSGRQNLDFKPISMILD